MTKEQVHIILMLDRQQQRREIAIEKLQLLVNKYEESINEQPRKERDGRSQRAT